MRKTSVIMNRLQCNYGIVVKTQHDPTPKDVEFILNEAESVMKSNGQGRFPFADRGIGITMKPLAKFNQPVIANSIQIESTEDLDFFALATGKEC